MTARISLALGTIAALLLLTAVQTISAGNSNGQRCDPRVCEEWVANYDIYSRVSNLQLGTDGDLFAVSVLSGQLIRFNPEGLVTWEYKFNAQHEPSGLAIDHQDNTYVSSYVGGTVECAGVLTQKISPQGQRLWFACTDVFASQRAVEVLLHESENIYVAGETSGGYLIFKLDSQGQEEWSLAIESEPGFGQAYYANVALDTDGSVYLTGMSDGDWLTVKLDADGEERWRHRLDGPAQLHDRPWDIAVAEDHSVYVTGQISTTSGDTDFLTVKYTPDGDIIWTREYSTPFEGPDGSTDIADAVVLDADQNVVVAGGSSPGTALIKYSPEGNILWTSHDCRGVLIRRMVIGESGEIVIVGDGPVAMRYAGDGSLLWRADLDQSETAFDRYEAVAVDGDTVYAGGDVGLNGIITKYVGRNPPPALPGDQANEPLRCNELRGDVLCDNVIDGRDAIGLLLYVAGEAAQLENWCLGREPNEYFELDSLNLDCSGNLDGADVLLVLRYRAGLPFSIPPDCPTFPIVYPDGPM